MTSFKKAWDCYHCKQHVIFLGRKVKAPQIRRAEASSKRKVAHIVHVTHRDEVESPITDWIQEAYEKSDELSERLPRKQSKRQPAKSKTRRR